MNLLIIYCILSYFLTPAVAGFLDKRHDTGYPIDSFFFIIISPLMFCCVALVLICKEVMLLPYEIKASGFFKRINIFEKIYYFCKGEK